MRGSISRRTRAWPATKRADDPALDPREGDGDGDGSKQKVRVERCVDRRFRLLSLPAQNQAGAQPVREGGKQKSNRESKRE